MEGTTAVPGLTWFWRLAELLAINAAGAALVRPDPLPAIEAELAQVNQERSRLVSAIAAGGQLDALLQALQAREARRTMLEAQREQLRTERRLKTSIVCAAS